MRIKFCFYLVAMMALCFSACQNTTQVDGTSTTDSTAVSSQTETLQKKEQIIKISQSVFDNDYLDIDLNQDLSNKSLEELRLLRNALFARQGYLFMSADLRGFFAAQKGGGYDSLMKARWEAEDAGEHVKPIALTPEEQIFADKIKKLEEEKLKKNFIEKNGVTVPNIENIVNLWQYENIDAEFLNKLSQNGFVIVPNDNIQLFHVYEENDYRQTPNFVTTDMYLQLFHMYFMYVLKTLEEDSFMPMLTDLVEGLYNANYKLAQNEQNPDLKAAAEWNSTYFAIAYHLLTQKNKPVVEAHKVFYQQEIKHVNEAKESTSEFLDYPTIKFPYSLFKPRGHYTRKESLKKYFKAMMWIQTVPQCLDNDKHLHRMVLNAYFLNTEQSAKGKALIQLYQGILEPTITLIGEPDNLAVLAISELLNEKGIQATQTLVQNNVLSELRKNLKVKASQINKIRPIVEHTCPDKINLMPQRYLVDNEILLNLVDIKEGEPSKRPFPRGLDVFAAFGNKAAEKILFETYNEDQNWNEYKPKLLQLQDKLDNYGKWDDAIYNKWIQTLLKSFEYDKRTPEHLKSEAWDLKTLNTSLASWAELKHDAILYGEQPMAAECGGGGPPDPYTVGYVEPNTVFWKSLLDLLDLNKNVLEKHGLFDSFEAKSKEIREQIEFLLAVSEKQLDGQKLSEAEYQTIEFIGGAVEMLTLSVLDKDLHLYEWNLVEGPDKSVSVVADIFTNNADAEKAGVLHVGVGTVNDLYVVVEIEGYLYLTRGGTFGYHEFVQPLDTRLTDEEWQKMLETPNAPELPDFLKPILYQGDKKPKSNEKVMYSSGC